VGLVLSGGVLMAIFLAWRITRPILRVVAAAKAISSGDLDTPSPQVEDSNEFG
jgi:nitrogen fixation/metabolism regulation signal transduction histidine kinase